MGGHSSTWGNLGARSRKLVPLPSRESTRELAQRHWDDGRDLAVFGESGSGRTLFAERVLQPWAGPVHRFTGKAQLQSVPFAALAAIAAQATGSSAGALAPLELITMLAVSDPHGAQRTLVLDDAEFVDDASAAACAQAAIDSGLRIILISTSASKLPVPLRALALRGEVVNLEPLTDADSVCIVEEVLTTAVTIDTAHTLAEAAGRNARYLRELVVDAQESDAFDSVRGYTTLNKNWRPHGRRIGEFVAVRLEHQNERVRRAVEMIAITGDISRSLAVELAGAEHIDGAIAADLLETSNTSSLPNSDADLEIVRMGTGLTTQTVLAGKPVAELREHAEQALTFLDKMDPLTRISVAVHASRIGVRVNDADRETIVAAAVDTRQFTAVLAITEPDGELPELSEDLVLARSRALFELGRGHEALVALGSLPSHSQTARIWAATIIAADGRVDEAEALLKPRPEDDSVSTIDMTARLDLLRARSGRRVTTEQLRSHALNPELAPDVRTAALQSALFSEVLTGRSLSVVEEVAGMLGEPSWQQIPITGQVELLATLFLAAVASGGSQHGVTDFGQSEWAALHIPAGLFLGAEGLARLETGDGANAADMLRQALVALGDENRFGMTAYFAAAAASASALLGDSEAATELFDTAAISLAVGGALNAEAERMLLPAQILRAVAHASAPAAVAQRWRDQVDRAKANGHQYVYMRLLHDGWRWGLHNDLALVSASATGVQGALAAALAEYSEALSGDSEALERALMVHRAAAQKLFAGELALAAVRFARDRNHKRPASILVTQAVETMTELSGVDTPILGRVRIDRSLLSEREFEVSIRAISGISSAEIAQQLFLSIRTVEGHLQRAFGKLGIAGRQQMAPPSVRRVS
ncbi:LuxR C-terminal-related transcriptional regulator [Rhodoglobus sp. NPDC076762]